MVRPLASTAPRLCSKAPALSSPSAGGASSHSKSGTTPSCIANVLYTIVLSVYYNRSAVPGNGLSCTRILLLRRAPVRVIWYVIGSARDYKVFKIFQQTSFKSNAVVHTVPPETLTHTWQQCTPQNRGHDMVQFRY